jgi:protein tyrosine phosphatase
MNVTRCDSRTDLISSSIDPFEVTLANPVVPTWEQAMRILTALNSQDRQNHTFPPYDKLRDRYDNILQPLETMVPLPKGTMYNGARFVHPTTGKVYILMQGPLIQTLPETREMMDHNNVSQIVCLTKDKEAGKDKCYPYWNTWESLQETTCVVRTPDEDWKPSQMIHYETWPDNGVPGDTNHFIEFVKFQRAQLKEGAVCVHCSAGIGRTAVFMITTLMMDEIEAGKKVLSPLTHLSEIRKVRPSSIQSPEQLQFCFKIAYKLLQNA